MAVTEVVPKPEGREFWVFPDDMTLEQRAEFIAKVHGRESACAEPTPGRPGSTTGD